MREKGNLLIDGVLYASSASISSVNIGQLNAVTGMGVSNVGNTIGDTGTRTGVVVLQGGNNITLSQITGASTNTVIISAGAAGGTLSRYYPNPIVFTGNATVSANTNTSGSATFYPFILPQAVAVGWVGAVVSMNMQTTGDNSWNQNHTMNWGIYSRGLGTNSTILSQFTSNSLSWAFTNNSNTLTISQPTSTGSNAYTYSTTSSAGTALSSAYTGLKLMHLALGTTLTAGDWWLGYFHRASTTNANSGILISHLGQNPSMLTAMAPMGSFSASQTTGTALVGGLGNFFQAMGIWSSVGQTNLPGSLAISGMTYNQSMLPYLMLWTTA